MQGQMMAGELLISGLITHAAQYHGDTEIISVNTGGGDEITTWRAVEANARAVASALTQLGLEPQARCGTIAWNNRRHLEIYFGTSGGGFVCHTLNPRLPPQQLAYILNHAEDKVLFIERTFVPLLAAVRAELPHLEHVILMEAEDGGASETLPGLILYDDFIAGQSSDYAWPQFDERTASSLCYTSGTTGNPKGVLYSHRSTMLHAFASNTKDCIGFSACDVVLPVVPMFHVNAWGVPYAAAMSGSPLVMTGPGLDGPSPVLLIDTYLLTIAPGVPTLWFGPVTDDRSSGYTFARLTRPAVAPVPLAAVTPDPTRSPLRSPPR